MQSLAKYLGLLALVGTILPPTLFMFKLMPLDPMKWTMLVAAAVWFLTAPVWMKGSE